MASYNELLALIDAYINQNGVQAITGQVLNGVLRAMVDQLGRGYSIMGAADPTTDPGTPDGPETWFASVPGTYTNFDGIQIVPGELALLSYVPSTGFSKNTIYEGFQTVQATIDGNVGTPAVGVSYANGILSFDFHNMKGVTGDPAGFGAVTASVDSNIGTPSVQVQTSGPDTAKAIAFQFHNLKGETGVTSVLATVDNTSGNPQCAVSLNGQQLVLNFTGLKGAQGDTGSSVDYPFTIVNNLTTNDPAQALSAAMGVQLESEVSQLEAEVNGEDISSETTIAQSLTAEKYYNTNGTIPNSPSNKTGCYCAKISVSPGEKYRVKGVKSSGVATRLWCTADSERARVSYASTGDGTTRNTVDIDIPESGVAYLVVNLVDYDSQTDGFWKVVSTSTHQDGLVDKVEALDERVEALEDAPALNVIDSLDSESATDPLSANQGRVINEEINGVTTPTYTDQPLQAYKYFNTQNSRVPAADSLADATGTYAAYIFVTPGEVYRIYGKGDSGAHQLYAMADADRYVVQDGIPGVAMNTRSTPLDLTIPEGVARLVVNLYQYDSATDKVQKVGSVTSESIKTRIDALEGAKQLALPLMGKKVMFFGDSITDYTYNQKGLVNYFADASLSSCYKAAIGGTRFVQRTTPVDTPTTNNEAYAALDICNMVKAWCEANYTKQDAATTFLNDHTARVNALKNNPIGGVDIVCIGGGTNDMSSSSPIGNDSDNDFTTIKGSINKMVELLLTANPKLKIYFYSPVVGYHGSGGRTDANWDDNHQFSSGLTKPQYIEIFAERAKKNHIPYIDIYWTLGWNQTNFSTYFLDSDDHHPYKGFDVIGRRLYQQVVTNLE